MSTLRSLPALVSLALGAALLATTVSAPAMAAKGDRKKDRQQRAEEPAPAGVISTVRGDRYRIGRAKVATRLTRITDEESDQVTADGSPLPDAPAWTDIVTVTHAPFRFGEKMARSVKNAFPRGSNGTYYGPDADWSVGDRGRFVMVELAEPRPDDTISQLIEVGFDGNAAGPLQVGSSTDTRAGVEIFTLAGRFTDGSEAAGTTDVSGRAPGDQIAFYNARSGVFGLDAGEGRYQFLLPEPGDATAITVSVRSTTDQGEVIDRLELPDGGHLVPLDDPGLGFKAADGALPLGCRSISTAAAAPSSEDNGVDGEATTMISYRVGVGVDPDTGEPADAAQAFAALDGMDSVPLQAQRLDIEEEPVVVDGRLSLAPALGTLTLTIDVPPGTWSFAPVEPEALTTPAGEALIDHRTLTGRAGVRTGEGLVGFVSGDPDCGLWDIGAAACSFVPGADLEALVPAAGSGLEQVDIAQADGSAWCVGRVPDTRDAKYIVRIGREYATPADLQAAVESAGCPATPIDVGTGGQVLDCAAAGNFERILFQVVPDVTAGRDPDGGFLVSSDLVVDPGRPVGERYDSAAALALFAGLAADLAAAARPAGATATTDADADVTPTDDSAAQATDEVAPPEDAG
jgi:hypothetical protein